MTVVGYTLSVPDNGTFMSREKSESKRCDACGYLVNFLAHNPNYESRKRERDYKLDGYVKTGADISSTYDLHYIVSDRFRDFCVREGYEGLVFQDFIKDRTHFHFTVEKIVKFDAVRRDTVFERICKVCKNYESVVGATPTYLLRSSALADGFYRTDLLFGSGDRKSPAILVGAETKAKLQAAKLKGLKFLPAYGIEPQHS